MGVDGPRLGDAETLRFSLPEMGERERDGDDEGE